VNRQYQELKEKNPNAFVWVDDPGLGLIFSALSGYNEVQARSDLDQFLEGLEGPKGVHLCAKPDWDFLLKSKLEILSFDSFNCGAVIVNYSSLREFINKGGIISWGIVPTYTEILEQESIDSLQDRLETFWEDLARKGVDRGKLLRQSLLAPATCNLMNVDKEKSVEKAFEVLKNLSMKIREKYGLAMNNEP
jgi:predicted nucleotide-binding protein (sugar kinase/HSP70/actin superfamily)